jgi:hypothetical protein
MSELGKMDIPDDIFEVIQSSIPDGQTIRHIALIVHHNSSHLLNRSIPATEHFLAVTDSFLIYRTTRWDWELIDEPSWNPKKVAKFNKIKNKFADHFPTTDNYWVTNSSLYGPIRPKWLPEIIFQRNLFISDIEITIPYELVQATKKLAKPFKDRGHQLDVVGSFGFHSDGLKPLDGFGPSLFSFFDDIKQIYDHIQDTQLRKKLALDSVGQTSSNSKSQITKCLNCASTELTVRGEYVVCDYCQSKFPK